MRKDNHHILIKNLATNEEQGFMLASGDTPYSIQGVDNVAQRIADGEILYSDFSNSRVFAQSDWDGGISKYWWPERTYSVIYPSKKYKDKKNIRIDTGEFTLGGSVTEEYDIPFIGGDGPMCKGESVGVVYLGSGMQLYRSTDFGNSWSVFKDFSGVAQLSDVNEITDITLVNTKSAVWTHASPMGSVSVPNIQGLFVAFYNRTTKVSGLARYDISFTIRGANGTTRKDSWGGSTIYGAAYGSKRDSFVINTNGLSTGSVAAYKVNNAYGFTIPSTWQSYGLFPGQRIKMTRTNTGVVYGVTVAFVGGAFGGTGEIGIMGLPSYDAGTDLNNFYTITEIGQNSSSICFPISGGIENYIAIGFGLGQNIIYGGVTYNVSCLGNGRDTFGNNAGYLPGTASGTSDYVVLTRIDGVINAYALYGNGTITVVPESWIYKYGTYNNRITKFATCEKEFTHIWGYNDIDPENKLYDVAFGDTTSTPVYSNIYTNSFNGVLHSVQGHTITFNNGDCPISGAPRGYAEGAVIADAPTIFIGTQFGTSGIGTQSTLYELTLDDVAQSAPSYVTKGIVGCAGITSMVYFLSKLYMGSIKRGMIYEYDNTNSKVTEIAQVPRDDTTGETVIDAITVFAGKIVCSYQKGSGVYVLDPNTRTNDTDPNTPLIETDVLCSVETLSNIRIKSICNTGGLLLFTDGDKVYSYDQDGVASQGYMESSIYGGYISNVDKLWVYAYVRVGKWWLDDGQRVAMEVSMDEGITWNFIPSVPGKPFSPTNSWSDIYSIDKGSSLDDQQLTFFFPYNTKSGTIIYRCWLKKGATVVPIVNHIGVHYNLNYKQELLFNYQLDLNKAMELLGGRTIEKDLQGDKLAFLKNIWQNQDMVLLTDVTGKKYTCMPFSDDRTPGQGLVISTSNSNTAHLDLNNLSYRVAFSLKTIANYEKTL